MKTIAISLITLLLASQALANEAHKRIQAMNETQRQEFLTRYMRQQNPECIKVNKTFAQGVDKSGNAYWSVGCTTGSAFQILIKNDAKGSSQTLDCKILKAVKGGNCFTKFK